MARPRQRRAASRCPDQTGRLGPVRRHCHVPRTRRLARDQDRPGIQAWRRAASPGPQGDRIHRPRSGAASGQSYISPPPHHGHLLDRGPRPAHRGPACDQPEGADRGRSSWLGGRGDHRGRRRQGGRLVHPPVGSRRRDRRPRRSRRSSTSARRGSSASPRSTRSLLRNDLRDRVTLRTDGGLQTGRDLLVAALLGAEEFAFGTAALVAIGCDMARQCHLDTCRPGSPPSARTCGPSSPGPRTTSCASSRRSWRTSGASWRRSGRVRSARSWVNRGVSCGPSRLPEPSSRRSSGRDRGPRRRRDVRTRPRPAARPLTPRRPPEVGIATRFRGQGSVTASGLRLTTADRSFGTGLTGALESAASFTARSGSSCGATGQSFGAFAGPGVELRLVVPTATSREGPVGWLDRDRARARPRRRGVVRRSPATRALRRDRRPAALSVERG